MSCHRGDTFDVQVQSENATEKFDMRLIRVIARLYKTDVKPIRPNRLTSDVDLGEPRAPSLPVEVN